MTRKKQVDAADGCYHSANLTWLLTGLLGLLLAGCPSTPKQPDYPSDPLLVSKKAVEGHLQQSRPVAVVQAEPVVPAVPPVVLAARQRQFEKPRPSLPDIVSPGGSQSPYQPTSRQKE